MGMSFQSEGGLRQVVAVFRPSARLDQAAEAARRAGARGVDVGSRRGEILALDAEMRDEMEHTIVGPGNVGPFTKESTKGVSIGVIVATVIGAIVALPLTAMDFGLPFWQRVAIAVGVGALTGATVGFVLGGGLGARGPAEPLAAEEGTTLVATVPGDRLEAVELALRGVDGLIRLDVAVAGQPIDTVTEEPDTTVRDLADRTVQGEGDWSRVRSDDRAERR